MDIQMIAMDLDGTALQHDRCSFSPRLLAALNEAHERGIAVVPVTGRQFGLLPPVLREPHPWKFLSILCNGGQIRKLESGILLHGLEISSEALGQLLALAEEFDLPIEFSMDSTLHLTQHSLDQQQPWDNLTFHRDAILAKHGRIVDSLKPMCAPGLEKVNLLCIPPELRQEVAKRLNSVAVSAVWASSSSMEITHPDATKGQGLQRLCSIQGIPMGSVMALGDSGNDVTMLQQAGLGVAMGNAPDFVKQVAKVCTDTNDEDGAAKAIEQYVLN